MFKYRSSVSKSDGAHPAIRLEDGESACIVSRLTRGIWRENAVNSADFARLLTASSAANQTGQSSSGLNSLFNFGIYRLNDS